MRQRLTEWLEVTKKGHLEYYEKQLKNPYRSTVLFCQWLESFGLLDKNRKDKILDIGAGMGGQIYYMAKKYPKSFFVGIDINPILVKIGNEFFWKSKQVNCKLLKEDLYALNKKHIGQYKGIVSYQTLSWLPDYKLPIKKMAELKADWITITSLFYEGDVNCKITIQDYDVPLARKPYKEAFYNIYCLRLVRELFEKCGYSRFNYIPFEIDIDLPKPKTKGMGTYTERLANGKRIQISGPLLMNWYFILARK
jgi:SAM-dependent methyltransferase